ncbi:hypothetical protein OfM2_13970 [Lactovum odontotermitis]
MSVLRSSIYKHWGNEITSGDVEIYLMAISGHSNDKYNPNGRSKNKEGEYISPEYEHLMFVAKIDDIKSMKDYLKSDISKGRRDSQGCGSICCIPEIGDNEKVLLSHKFSYYGKEPLKLCEKALELFPKNRNYRKHIVAEKNKEYLAPLLAILNTRLAGENLVKKPYHPMWINNVKE